MFDRVLDALEGFPAKSDMVASLASVDKIGYFSAPASAVKDLKAERVPNHILYEVIYCMCLCNSWVKPYLAVMSYLEAWVAHRDQVKQKRILNISWKEYKRLILVGVEGDGNCLFRALALVCYKDEERHALIVRETKIMILSLGT